MVRDTIIDNFGPMPNKAPPAARFLMTNVTVPQLVSYTKTSRHNVCTTTTTKHLVITAVDDEVCASLLKFVSVRVPQGVLSCRVIVFSFDVSDQSVKT